MKRLYLAAVLPAIGGHPPLRMGLTMENESSLHLVSGPDLSKPMESTPFDDQRKAITALNNSVLSHLNRFYERREYDQGTPHATPVGAFEEVIASFRVPETSRTRSTESVLVRRWYGNTPHEFRTYNRLFLPHESNHYREDLSRFSESLDEPISRLQTLVSNEVRRLIMVKNPLSEIRTQHYCNLCGTDQVKLSDGFLFGVTCGHKIKFAA